MQYQQDVMQSAFYATQLQLIAILLV